MYDVVVYDNPARLLSTVNNLRTIAYNRDAY